MALAMAGDKAAYNVVLHKISASLIGYVGRKVPLKDRDDVVQDILLSIHKARHTYDCTRPLMPWVMAIARFRLSDHWRQYYGHSFHEMANIEDMKNILSEDKTKSMESHEDINRILLSLPPKQQEILDLMYRQDKTVKEVADLLKMNISAVKTAAHRSYKVFRKRMMQ